MRLLSYRWSYYAGKPEELFKELIWRPFKNLVFRFKNGYFASDTWSLDYTTAKWILPRLKGFLKVNNGYPGHEGDPYCQTFEDWQKTIGHMIEAFQGIIDEDDNWEEWHKNIGSDKEKYRVHMERRHIGLMLFGRYFQHLWW